MLTYRSDDASEADCLTMEDQDRIEKAEKMDVMASAVVEKSVAELARLACVARTVDAIQGIQGIHANHAPVSGWLLRLCLC